MESPCKMWGRLVACAAVAYRRNLDVSATVGRAQGARGLIVGEQPFPSQLGGKGTFEDWDYAFWFSPAVTLGVGTQEILKNVVAERVLGLPREADPTARVPWSQSRKAG